MRRSCEVCRNFRPERGPEAGRVELVPIELGKRSVLLCATHAYILRWSRVATFEGLRKLFRENDGKRSFVPRRAREQHRSSERRARSAGRRASDVEG
jgi:hypothetical protein